VKTHPNSAEAQYFAGKAFALAEELRQKQHRDFAASIQYVRYEKRLLIASGITQNRPTIIG